MRSKLGGVLLFFSISAWAQGFAHAASGSCTYSGSGACSVTARANSSSGVSNNGSLNVTGVHGDSYSDAQGVASANGGKGATADSQGVAAFNYCSSPTGCGINIPITGSGSGGGFNVGFSPAPIWQDGVHYVNACDGETSPGWNKGCDTGPYGTPLIVDTTGQGFRLSDPQTACIMFNLDGTPKCYSWPVPGSGNAWLVYDRDGDGKIDSGQELFGNFTPHSDGGIANNKDANGFLALAWFDQPAQGGNMDLIIDKRDKVWSHLKLWIDEHCYKTPTTPCSALPSELYPLESKGIESISLVYGAHPTTDSNGNNFKFVAILNPDAHDTPVYGKGLVCCDLHQKSKNDSRKIFDVYLMQQH